MAEASPLPLTVPHSLEEIHASVPVPPASWWRRFLAFSGPAFLVSVGYMDPGNWGTDIEAGSRFGYRLLWVLALSNLMAVLLQTLATRLGVVTGQDLAQACRAAYPRKVVTALWVLCELAIAATDLAEVIGAVIALKLLFGIPYVFGLLIAAGDTFLLLALQRRGVRLLEVVTLALIAVIAGSFVAEIVLARPDWAEVIRGLAPGLDTSSRENFSGSLYVAIGMIGATVMPHNLYLHSALVQTRSFAPTTEGKRLACRYNLFDSLLALNGAFFVNAAILVLAVTTFYGRPPANTDNRIDKPGTINAETKFDSQPPADTDDLTLQDAHQLLGNVWGPLASYLFAVALLASGQSSTLTGTLAGQVVMEGFVHLRVRPWVRRLITRLLAILPAMAVVLLTARAGDGKSTDRDLLELLVFSQVILSFQLPFAIVPLVQFTGDRSRMGSFANGPTLKTLSWACAAIVLALNAVLVWLTADKWSDAAAAAGWSRLWVYGTLGPLAVALAGFLGWLTLHTRRGRLEAQPSVPPPALPAVRYHNIGVAVEFVANDEAVLTQAAALARSHGAEVLLLHVVEGTAADYFGPVADDQESRSDRTRMAELVAHLCRDGLTARGELGYGEPAKELLRLARENQLDLLVLGSHGHRLLGDLALGQTVSPLLHRSPIPILVVPTTARTGEGGGWRPVQAASDR
jgi:manganese transport protein